MSAGPEDVKPCVKCGARDRKKPQKGRKIGNCRPCVLARQAAWRADNPKKARAQYTAYRAANPEKCRDRSAAWRAADPQKARDLRAAWNAANREKIRAQKVVQQARRKARKLQATVDPNCPKVKAIYARAASMRARGHDVHVDHIIPLAKGGPHTADNLKIIPAVVNIRKGAKLPEEFYGA